MQRLDHPRLRFNPWPGTKWTAEDKPILIVDGVLHKVRSLPATIRGEAAYAVGMSDRNLAKLAAALDVELLHFYELRAADLSPLTTVRRLRYLKIHWNTKIVDLSAVGELRTLETLILVDTPKIRQLEPLMHLSALAALEYSGGIWNRNHAASFDPLAALPNIEELVLTNLRVESGGLRPLAQCRSLKRLTVSNQFDTEDYAYLSVALPQVQCQSFAPWIRVSHTNGFDTMIIGKRKPFLNSKVDYAKIIKYEAAFQRMQEKFASNDVFQRMPARGDAERER